MSGFEVWPVLDAEALAAQGALVKEVIAKRQVNVVYQPIVDLRTRKTFAYEALVRCPIPEFASPPALFHAAETHGVTGELGRVIREIAVQRCTSTPLFLNIHPAELNQKWVVQPDDPIFTHDQDIYLEITEGVPLSHFQLCQTILGEVRGRGVFLVVDDFGAGYSNIKYIADLNPRVVKLDRGLIAGLTRDSRMFKLVRWIVALCKEMDAVVVAEGIETLSELEAVREAGARLGQGYLLARPAFPPPEVNWPGQARFLDEEDTRMKPGDLTSKPSSESQVKAPSVNVRPGRRF